MHLADYTADFLKSTVTCYANDFQNKYSVILFANKIKLKIDLEVIKELSLN